MILFYLTIVLQDYVTLEETLPELAFRANLSLEAYSFPVQIILAYPNGTVLHSTNLNDFMALDAEETR